MGALSCVPHMRICSGEVTQQAVRRMRVVLAANAPTPCPRLTHIGSSRRVAAGGAGGGRVCELRGGEALGLPIFAFAGHSVTFICKWGCQLRV